jgi:hypothetical protein
MTYVLLTCPRMPGPRVVRWLAQPVRLALGRSFLRRDRDPGLREHVAHAAEVKALDRNMRPDEVRKALRLAARMRRGTPGRTKG